MVSAAFDAAVFGPAVTLGVVESLAAVALHRVLPLVGLLHLDGEAAECLHLEDLGLLGHGYLGRSFRFIRLTWIGWKPRDT